MTNTRQLKSRNQREGWYFGFYNKHLRAYQIDSLQARIKQFKTFEEIKRRFFHE